MSHYRLAPTIAQGVALRDHCAHARYVWNLAVEQHSWWRPGRGGAPAYLDQCRQLTGAGLNREIMRSGWGLLARRLGEKAPGRVEKVNPAYTSQRCSACGHIAAESRKSQALFACVACSFACNADVNAARNIAAGHAVTARGGDGVTRPVNREPQLLLRLA
jgi:transposase